MSGHPIEWSILLPAFVAGVLVLSTHVPLGMQVLQRGIVFIDLAIAQIAGLGVIAGQVMGFEPHGIGIQLSAIGAAIVGSLLLAVTDRRWPDVQEAVIGVSFILAATASILLLAQHPQGGEHLRDLLVGQILWVNGHQLLVAALVNLPLVVLWFGWRERVQGYGFYFLFACAVTVSVQLVGIFLVFASLIVPALATRHFAGSARYAWAYGLGVLAYALGLFLASWQDWPAGALIVWTLAALGGAVAVFARPTRKSTPVRTSK